MNLNMKVSVVLFFNRFASRIETSVTPWDQLLYPCVVEVAARDWNQSVPKHFPR